MVGTRREETAPLLGRDEKRSLLRSVLDEVATRGQPLLLRGEPGIGKTRLLSDTAHVCAAILVGRSYGGAVITEAGNHARVVGPV